METGSETAVKRAVSRRTIHKIHCLAALRNKYEARPITPFTTDAEYTTAKSLLPPSCRTRVRSWNADDQQDSQQRYNCKVKLGSWYELKYAGSWKNAVVVKKRKHSLTMKIFMERLSASIGTRPPKKIDNLLPPCKIVKISIDELAEGCTENLSDLMMRDSNIKFPKWVTVGCSVWIYHSSTEPFHGWMPGKIRAFMDGKCLSVSFIKSRITNDLSNTKSTKNIRFDQVQIAQRALVTVNDEEIIGTDTLIRPRTSIRDEDNWFDVHQHLKVQTQRDVVHHVIKSCADPETLSNFVERECDGKSDILDEIMSFLVNTNRLLFLTPPSTFSNTKRQVIIDGNDCIEIKFVLNESVEVIGVKILNIDPKSKEHWRIAELFGIPLHGMKDGTDSDKLLKMYNIRPQGKEQRRVPSKMSKEVETRQARTSFPCGVPLTTAYEDIADLHKSLKMPFHSHRDSDDSQGLFWRQPMWLMENTLYCLRLKLTAFKDSKVFVQRWYGDKFRGTNGSVAPLYNYDNGSGTVFRSLHFQMPDTMDFIPHIAIMKNHDEILPM